MGLIDDVVNSFEDKPVEDIRIGDAYLGVRIGNRIGLSHRVDESVITDLNGQKYIGKKCARLLYSDHALDAAIGTAVINAQLNPVNTKTGNIFKKILKISKQFNRIGIIGKFPIIDQLRDLKYSTIHAFEQKNIPGFLPAELEDELIPQCDLIIISGTTFVNKTLSHLLDLCSGYTVIVGPTTPLSDVLFDYGADILAGIICTNNKVLDIIASGGGTKEFKKFVELVYIERNSD